MEPDDTTGLPCDGCGYEKAANLCSRCGDFLCGECLDAHPCAYIVEPFDARELEIEDEVSRMEGGAPCS